MSNNEVAHMLGRTEGAVKALQHRALVSLHQILQQEANEAQARESGLPVEAEPATNKRITVLRGPLDGLIADSSMDLLERT